MKKQLFSGSAKENSIFLDERFLYPEFIPDSLPHRETEITSLVQCFNPVLSGRKPLNVFMSGPTGVGKTVCVKFVLNELQENFDRAKYIYLNCFEYGSRQSVLSAIANFVGAAIPRRGLATDEIFSKLVEFMRKCGYVPIVILDEVDQLLLSAENAKILYDLLRIVEYEKLRIGVVMISNDVMLTSRLDPRIKSSMAEQALLFEAYTPVQLRAIIGERCNLAFMKGAIRKDEIGLVAGHAAKLGGDCRVAFESLLKAGRIAERENSSKVKAEHLRRAFEEVDAVSLVKGLKHLEKDELVLLRIISENAPIISGKIHEIYSREGELKERRIRDILTKLEQQNFVSAPIISLGNKGKSKEYSSKIPKQFLLKEINALIK